jgi:signal transduction histidine kinase
MRIFIWLSVPLSFHLHWIFPRPFSPWKKSTYFILYGLISVIIVLDFSGVLPNGFYLVGFIAAMINALTMLLIKYVRFKDLRAIMRSLLSAYLIAIVPLILIAVLMLFNAAPSKGSIALLGLTALPGFYFFTAYRTNLNREIPRVSFAMRLFTWGIVVQFTLMFLVMLIPAEVYNSLVINVLAFSMIITLSVTDFGILLIMPALANDQINLFQTRSYSLRFSANRAAALANYLLFIGPLTAFLILLLPQSREIPFINVISFAVVIMIVTGLTIVFYHRFQKFFDRVVLGIKLPSEELVHNYLQRITTSLDAASLAALIKEEILPSLLIRESVLVELEDSGHPKILVRSGINDQDLEALLEQAQSDKALDPTVIKETCRSLPWVRLTLPLTFEGKAIGLWCMGWKDPNNVYDSEFTKMLETLAHQTTLALLNIRQRNLLQALYNINIERQEAEKAMLARDLHDVLMPSLGYLVELQGNGADLQEFEQAIQQINDMIRDIMSGLRPSSLDMGLDVALEELADQPEAQIGGKIDIQTSLEVPKPVNYDQTVELHLYRIIQQACRNAFEHAEAKSILVSGTLKEDRINLTVSDDGSGFPLNGLPDLGALLANHHFGLANIFERAKLIGADVAIESEPKQGTKLKIVWPSNNDR